MQEHPKRARGKGMWHFIISLEAIPKGRNVRLAVVDRDGFHELEFLCRCNEDGCWIDVKSGRLIDVRPTHWRAD